MKELGVGSGDAVATECQRIYGSRYLDCPPGMNPLYKVRGVENENDIHVLFGFDRLRQGFVG